MFRKNNNNSNNYKNNYKNKIISLSLTKNKFTIISNYTHKIITRMKKKLIIPNSVHVFENHTTHYYIIPNNINKYNVNKYNNHKKKLLHTIYINKFYSMSNVNTFLLENINKIEIHQFGDDVLKQNMIYFKGVKHVEILDNVNYPNIQILNSVNYRNIQILKNIYSFYVRSKILHKNIQNIFLLNNLYALFVYNLKNFNEPNSANNIKVNFNKIKRIYGLFTDLNFNKNINICDLMYITKLRIDNTNIVDINTIGTVCKLTICHISNKYINFTMFKNIKDITIYEMPNILDILCLKNIHTLKITNCQVIINIKKSLNIHTLKIMLQDNRYANTYITYISNLNKFKNVHTLITNIQNCKNCVLNNCIEIVDYFLKIDVEKIQCVKHIKFSTW